MDSLVDYLGECDPEICLERLQAICERLDPSECCSREALLSLVSDHNSDCTVNCDLGFFQSDCCLQAEID